jgi:hypothetical protein
MLSCCRYFESLPLSEPSGSTSVRARVEIHFIEFVLLSTQKIMRLAWVFSLSARFENTPNCINETTQSMSNVEKVLRF